MKDSIIKKIRTILDSGVDSECKVSYVLAESRKLLETYPPDPAPFALRLYCNWALHIDLDHTKTTLPFLQRLDEFVASVLGEKNEDIVLEHRMLREFIFLDTFRVQFSELLNSYALPTKLCDDDNLWHEFLTHYAGIIEDGSLSCRSNSPTLKWVKEVVFTKGRTRTDGFIPFDLTWEIQLLDGRTLAVSVSAMDHPTAGLMMRQHLHIHAAQVALP